ncbi:MAG: zinc-binding dehydrogenase [Bacteroidota bacterium]
MFCKIFIGLTKPKKSIFGTELGTAALQIAKVFGAEITGVCSSSNFEMVNNVGADNVIDNTIEDFTINGLTYDIILDALDGRVKAAI